MAKRLISGEERARKESAHYQAYCTGCGATYPGPFRVPLAPGHQAAA